MTNASFKQWVGILLMPKIDRAHKNYLTPEIWEETHLREIFYGTLIFQQSSMICIGCHVEGRTLALQHGGQNYFLQKSHFGHVTSYELTHFKKMVQVWKTKSLLFCLRYDPLIVFRKQNHVTFIFINRMSHDHLGQMAYYNICI